MMDCGCYFLKGWPACPDKRFVRTGHLAIKGGPRRHRRHRQRGTPQKVPGNPPRFHSSINGGNSTMSEFRISASNLGLFLLEDYCDLCAWLMLKMGHRFAFQRPFPGMTCPVFWVPRPGHLNIKPAALRAKIGKVGWHTFRHSYSTLLHSFGATPAVQKELLRHANIQTTLNIYTQAVSDEKQKAAKKVLQTLYQVVPGESGKGS